MQGSSSNSLQLEHHFLHPPSKVWQAWTDPAVVKMWFGSDPNGIVLDATLDVRVNGSFRVKFSNSDGTEYIAKGIYKNVETNRKLSFTWGWEDRPSIIESISLEFKGETQGTVMSFTHHDIDKDTAHNYAEGWRSTFKKLEKVLNS